MNNMEFKTYGAYALYTTMVVALNNIHIDWYAFVILAILLVADTILWVGKSYVLEGHTDKRFSSRKLKVGVISKTAILLLVLLIGLAISVRLWDSARVDSARVFVNSILWLLIAWELISIIQNVIIMKTKEPMEEWDAVSAVLKFALWVVKKQVQEKIDHDLPPTQ